MVQYSEQGAGRYRSHGSRTMKQLMVCFRDASRVAPLVLKILSRSGPAHRTTGPVLLDVSPAGAAASGSWTYYRMWVGVPCGLRGCGVQP